MPRALKKSPKKIVNFERPAPPPTLAEKLATRMSDASWGAGSDGVSVTLSGETMTEIITALRRREVLPVPEEILTAWDVLSGDIDRVVTSLPAQLSEAVEGLEKTKRSFRDLLYKLAMAR